MIEVRYSKGSLQYLAWPPWVALHSHPHQVSDLGYGHTILLLPKDKSLMLRLCHDYVEGGKRQPVSLKREISACATLSTSRLQIPAGERQEDFRCATNNTKTRQITQMHAQVVNCISCKFGSGGRKGQLCLFIASSGCLIQAKVVC